MTSRSARPALALAAWTFLVWTTRIRNIWTDDDLAMSGQVWRTVLAGVFTLFAIGTVFVWRRGLDPSRWIRAFAVWTVGVWAIRLVQIDLADHDVAFIVVHSALAAVSTALAFWAMAAVESFTRSAERPTPV